MEGRRAEDLGARNTLSEFEVEHLAIVNALSRAGEIYAAASGADSRLQAILTKAARERTLSAEQLAAEWSMTVGSNLVTGAEQDDVSRRIASSLEALAELIDREERGLADLLSDAPAGVIDDETKSALIASVDDVRRAILNELMTLRAAAERPAPESRDFAMEWMQVGDAGGDKPPAHIFQLWYGTNREPVMRGAKLAGYSGERSERPISVSAK